MIMSSSFRDELEQQFSDLRFTLHAMIGFVENRVKFYRSTMEKSINDHKTYFSNDDLKELHRKLKNEILAQIQLQTDTGDFRIIVCICRRTHFGMKETTFLLIFMTDSRKCGLQQIGLGLSTVCQ